MQPKHSPGDLGQNARAGCGLGMGDPRPQPVWSLWELVVCFVAVWLFFLCGKAFSLSDPYYWDELACYFGQTLELAERPFDYLRSRPAYIRAPFFTAVLAAFRHVVGPSREAVRVFVLTAAALAPVSAYALCRQLFGSRKIAGWAAVLCAVTPACFAQSSLVLMDLPATGLSVLAFVGLLRGHMWVYGVLGGMAILTKESTYYIALPAALLLLARRSEAGVQGSWKTWTLWRTWLCLWPAAVPGFVLFLWLLVHRYFTGSMIAADHTAALGLSGLVQALQHNVVEGGRLPLSVCALLFLWKSRALCEASSRADVWATGLVWGLLPFAFPGVLPRYMLPSLPALCALGALCFAGLPKRRAVAFGAFVLAGLAWGYVPNSFHANPPFEIEQNLAYRDLLAEQVRVARYVAKQRPSLVVAEFPMWNAMAARPEYGYLEQPLYVRNLNTILQPADLCSATFVVTSEGGTAAKVALVKEAERQGVVSLEWVAAGPDFPIGQGRFLPKHARFDHTLRVYRTNPHACPH